MASIERLVPKNFLISFLNNFIANSLSLFKVVVLLLPRLVVVPHHPHPHVHVEEVEEVCFPFLV